VTWQAITFALSVHRARIKADMAGQDKNLSQQMKILPPQNV
jgi:hypothetical protein